MRSCPACKARVLAPRHFLRSPPRCPSCKAVVGPTLSFVILGMFLLVLANTFAVRLMGDTLPIRVASALLFVAVVCALAYFFAPLEVFPEPPARSPSTKLQRFYTVIALGVIVGFVVWLVVLSVQHGG